MSIEAKSKEPSKTTLEPSGVFRRKSRFPWRLASTIGALAVLSGGLGYYGWTVRGQYQAGLGELEVAKAEAARGREAELEVTSLTSKLGECKQRNEKEVARSHQVASSLEEIQGNLNVTRGELETLRIQREDTEKELSAFRDLTEKFQKMIDSGTLDVAIRQGRMFVKLPAGVLFESGEATLSRAGELAVMEVAIILRQLSDRRFMIAGHTDNRPLENRSEGSRYRNNWELSTARAVTVTEFLIEARMNPLNLVAAGHGQYDPVGDNTTAKGRQENRRIEIVLLPDLESVKSSNVPSTSKVP